MTGTASGRLGVFGGTFDPIHIGHLAAAESARDTLGLDQVLFMPSGQPPHKGDREVSPAEHRIAMVEAAIAGNPAFVLSRMEVDREGPSYTVTTLEALADSDPVLILSSEAAAGLPTWHEPERVLRLAALAIVSRDGYPDVGRADLRSLVPGRADPLPGHRWSAHPAVRIGVAGAGRGWAVAALPRPGCGHRVYRRPCPVPGPTEDPTIVTEPAALTDPTTPSADGLPRRDVAAPVGDRSALELARRIVELAEDKKAADIILLELYPITTLADYFVICSGGSERQLDAIADRIISTLRDEKIRPIGREGTPASHWVLVDFGSVIVHIFTPPERDYYGLEKHWVEAKTILRVHSGVAHAMSPAVATVDSWKPASETSAGSASRSATTAQPRAAAAKPARPVSRASSTTPAIAPARRTDGDAPANAM